MAAFLSWISKLSRDLDCAFLYLDSEGLAQLYEISDDVGLFTPLGIVGWRSRHPACADAVGLQTPGRELNRFVVRKAMKGGKWRT